MQANDIAGHAVYLEFQRGSATVQVLLTPEALTEAFQHVPPAMYRRQISISSPRSTWRNSALAPTADFDVSTGLLKSKNTDINQADLPSRVGVQMFDTSKLVHQLTVQEYKLNKQAVVVEVSVADMSDIRMGKTPYKVLNRITKSRKALGFSDSLFKDEA
jgi:hypothetical protein